MSNCAVCSDELILDEFHVCNPCLKKTIDKVNTVPIDKIEGHELRLVKAK